MKRLPSNSLVLETQIFFQSTLALSFSALCTLSPFSFSIRNAFWPELCCSISWLHYQLLAIKPLHLKQMITPTFIGTPDSAPLGAPLPCRPFNKKCAQHCTVYRHSWGDQAPPCYRANRTCPSATSALLFLFSGEDGASCQRLAALNSRRDIFLKLDSKPQQATHSCAPRPVSSVEMATAQTEASCATARTTARTTATRSSASRRQVSLCHHNGFFQQLLIARARDGL